MESHKKPPEGPDLDQISENRRFKRILDKFHGYLHLLMSNFFLNLKKSYPGELFAVSKFTSPLPCLLPFPQWWKITTWLQVLYP